MHKLTLAVAAFALAGCVGVGQPRVVATLRSPQAPIYSIAQIDPTRLDGRWAQAAGMETQSPSCKPGGAEITRQGAALHLAARWCDAAGQRRLSGAMISTGPGRFQIGQTELWVLWVDTDYRTLVLGDPAGTTLMVLNRNGRMPADRMTAVREILDFNGYRAAKLQPL